MFVNYTPPKKEEKKKMNHLNFVHQFGKIEPVSPRYPGINLKKLPQKGWKQKQETEIETKNFPKVHQSWPKQPPPVSVSLKCARNWKICFLFLGHIIETDMKTVFKWGGSLRKFWDKFCFYLFLFPSLMR